MGIYPGDALAGRFTRNHIQRIRTPVTHAQAHREGAQNDSTGIEKEKETLDFF